MESSNEQILKSKILLAEKMITSSIDIELLERIFTGETFIVGGLVRDALLDKKSNDVDLMTRIEIETLISNLQSLGLEELKDGKDKFKENCYSFKKDANSKNIALVGGVLSFQIKGIQYQVACIGHTGMETLILSSDLNINCCAFSLREKRVMNSKYASEVVIDKAVRFVNMDNIENDPLKILNALKQISRFPQLNIVTDTWNAIKNAMPVVIDFLRKNPSKKR